MTLVTLLGRIWTRFPEGSVHLAVVDPGVGSERRAVAARVGGRWLVGPDNGLVTDAAVVHGIERLRELDPGSVGLDPMSDTFHGRDLFAPAAAHLAAGRDPDDLGPELDPATAVRLELARADRDGEVIRGEVRHVDRFGNLITNAVRHTAPGTHVEVVWQAEPDGGACLHCGEKPGEG